MEQQPDEAVRVNVLGTKIVAELAAYYAAERFVFVSSDKAINPSSIMGATKRLGEILTTRSVPTTHNYYMIPISNSLKKFTNGVQPHHGHGAHGIRQNQANREINAITMHPTPPLTLFTAVRFGNVLGSRGSVVPTFARQIELGGPVTITHPEMKRYFISIAEAVSLVIQAAALTQGNDLFMLDMGQEVRIADLAHKMIRLRGLRPGEDISIQYTGIRPGEKLNEELLAPGEERLSTNYAKIFRIRSNNCLFDKAVFSGCLDQLIEMARAQQTDEMLELLWKLVQPETLLIKDEKMISKSLELEYEWGQNRFL
jgi:FlaA1/EpsC-like NDP-sugar epimerase